MTALQFYEGPTTPKFVKGVWRAIQVSMTGKESTTELTRPEVDQVYDVFSRFWSELTGEHFAFPTYEALISYDDPRYQ